MTNKLSTINLQGKAYAQVATRLKEFRERCPNGLVDTKHRLEEDGSWTFKATILKDKAVTSSGEGSGSSRGFLKDPKTGVEIPKAFEKLETIAVGRALAVLGFMASGEVASFEEMEDFLSEKETKRQLKIQEIMQKIDSIQNLSELREYYKTVKGTGVEVDEYIIERSKQIKAEDKE